jgi:hypothetical protein
MSKFAVIDPSAKDEVRACIRAMYKSIQRYGWELKRYGYEEHTKTPYYILSRGTDWFYVNLFVDEVGCNIYVNHQDDAVYISYRSRNDELKVSVGELNAITEFIEYVGAINCLELLKEESNDQNRED